MDVLLDDRQCLVVNKPGGILIQSPPGVDSLVDQVREFERLRSPTPDAIYIGVPHRLDRPASGAILFARTRRAAREMSEQFAGRLVSKEYWVLVEGRVSPLQGTWRDRIRKIPFQAHAEIATPEQDDAKIAVLHYHVEREDSYGCWLRIQLETGRMHQIRVQCGSRGYPVIGDSQYGAIQSFGPATDDERAKWIALHARRLTFRHPKTREKLRIEAPVPQAWLDLRPADYWTPSSDEMFSD